MGFGREGRSTQELIGALSIDARLVRLLVGTASAAGISGVGNLDQLASTLDEAASRLSEMDAAARQRENARNDYESCWLIESAVSTMCWNGGRCLAGWGTAQEAVRFSRRQDAEAVIRHLDLRSARATEHGFGPVGGGHA